MAALETLLKARALTNHLPIEEAIQAQGGARRDFGLQKYGVTLDRSDLSQLEWLQHLKEELMDAVRYCECQQRAIEAKMKIEKDDYTRSQLGV